MFCINKPQKMEMCYAKGVPGVSMSRCAQCLNKWTNIIFTKANNAKIRKRFQFY